MFAIMGVTGQVGGAVANKLLADGAKLRAIVRDPSKAVVWAECGCELALADINDAISLSRAIEGTDGAFVMLPPLFDPSPGFLEARRAIANLHGVGSPDSGR